jgi:hypothetical protein
MIEPPVKELKKFAIEKGAKIIKVKNQPFSALFANSARQLFGDNGPVFGSKLFD